MKKEWMKILLLVGTLLFGCLFAETNVQANTSVLEDGTYYINSSIDSGIRVDIPGGAVTDEANVSTWSANESNAQRFHFECQSNGYYVITAECSGKALTADRGAKGANVLLKNYDNNVMQWWDVKKNADGTYMIKSASGDIYLDITGGSTKLGTNVEVWEYCGSKAQKFTLTRVNSDHTLGDGTFVIASYLNDGMRLDVNREAYGDGVNVQLWSTNNSNAQKFAIKYMDDGTYTLTSLCSDMRLDVNGGSKKEGTNVQQWSANNSTAQRWKIKSVGNGYYTLQSVSSGLYLDISGANATNGVNIQQWSGNNSGAQYFRFYDTSYTQPLNDGCYSLQSGVDSNYYIDVTGGSQDKGTNIEVWTRNDSNAQKFQISYIGNGEYKIGCVCSGLFMDVNEGSSANGANVQQWANNDSAAQRWKIYHTEDGFYYFRSVASGKMLDVNGAVAYEGNNVQSWEFTGSRAQKFWLDKTAPRYTGWTTLNGRKYYYNGNGDLSSKLGVDVSVYQGDSIDWQAVKNDGIDFAIIRVGYGDNLDYQDDRTAMRNMDECERLGIPYGVYLYSYAASDEQANSEADHIIRMIEGRNPQMGVFIDIEDTKTYNSVVDPYSAEGRSAITRWTRIVLDRIRGAGFTPGVYANKNYFNNILYTDQLSDIKWLAFYGATNDPYDDYGCPDGPWSFWQYSSRGTVNGIPGDVDMNAWVY